MMRYRAKSYTIKYIAGNIFAIHIPSIPVTLPSDTTEATSVVREAIRLVIDETAKVVYCSSMQKNRLHQVSFKVPGYVLSLLFVAPEGKLSGITNHEFTVEFDFGEIPLVKSDLSDLKSAINAHTSNERETIMGTGTGEIADNVIDTQGLLIPGFTAVADGQTYYLAGFYIDDKVGAMPFQANEIMYTGAPNVGTCLRTDAYADIVTQTLQPDQIAALAIPIATTGDPYIDESGEVHNVVTEPMTLGKVYRLKSIVPITYNDPEEEITSFDLYVWEEAQATGRNIAETYNLIQETSQTIINELGNIDFEPLEQKVDTATEDIMGGKKVTHSMDNLPAAQCGTDNSDFRPVFIGDADYTLTEEYAFAIANGLSVGDVIRVLADNSGDGHEPMAVPKTINEAALAIVAYGSLPTIDGVTEWLRFEQHKHYIVTGIYETTYDGYTWSVYTFDEYEPGRSGREVYDKVEEVKTAVENIDLSSLAKQGSNNNISLTTMDKKLGNVVMMTNAEYAAFKSHMETEIANILTPITEE